MEKIALFYGSDTGCTDDVTKDFTSLWGNKELDIREISSVSKEDFDSFKIFFFGLSTWYDGDLQSDWETFFDDFKKVDFTNKVVAIYGLGDQVGYGEYFVDGIGILAKTVIENGGKVIGNWPVEGYRFTDSVALMEEKEGYFYGLAIDNDNQSQLSDDRLRKWVNQLKLELSPYLVSERASYHREVVLEV
ncbi:flavodoxin [Aquimarina muelleri]|uniref:Flavodoxin n=1 Tax=Aquimarina muelleri TaxID=279356 RepID=A0A918JXS5_9FLAO|nr:flavodoxin [Aquimarina muelleri]MCX2763241.1 flavodoxin [Aquimarina muelleri]GGX27744.1 flavodoxin [Aquimarina muelleri]